MLRPDMSYGVATLCTALQHEHAVLLYDMLSFTTCCGCGSLQRNVSASYAVESALHSRCVQSPFPSRIDVIALCCNKLLRSKFLGALATYQPVATVL